MKVKIGEYFRNKYGIAKVKDIQNKNGIDVLVFDRPICYLVNKETGERKDYLITMLALTEDIDINRVKHGKLIDLIEVGDYVNGKKVTKTNLDKTMNGETAILCGDSNYDCLDVIYKNCDIKSIVTKEHFESMEYKVER